MAELAAEGLTNREVAQSLFVSEKTVETHLGASTASSTSSRATRCRARWRMRQAAEPVA